MTASAEPSHTDFAAEVRDLAWTWLALIVLMLSSLGSAYLRLGVGNLLAGLVIAALKAGLVIWLFMQLRRASAMTRIAAAVGLATLTLLMTLSYADYGTRAAAPATWQTPQQIAPVLRTNPPLASVIDYNRPGPSAWDEETWTDRRPRGGLMGSAAGRCNRAVVRGRRVSTPWSFERRSARDLGPSVPYNGSCS